MSVANLATSAFVIKTGGVSNFGVYSFLFAFSILASGLCGALIHRQMVLHISPLSTQERETKFRTTLVHEIGLISLILFVFSIGLLVYTYVANNDATGRVTGSNAITFLCYITAFNVFELCRQYLYSQDLQTTSFRYTLYFIVALLTQQAFVLLFLDVEAHQSVSFGYATLLIALAISLLLNKTFRKALTDLPGQTFTQAVDLFKIYFAQGRFGTIGSFVTWLQNQSMGPLLMVIAGPVIVGYFNIGRLIVMPISVINSGIINSTMPQLRRTFVSDGDNELIKQLRKLGFFNVTITLMYGLLLFSLDYTSTIERFIDNYSSIRPFMLFWILLSGTTMVRFWIGQYFVITCKLKLLLIVGVIATTFSMTGLITAGVLFDNLDVALVFIILGEMLTIAMLTTLIHRLINKTAPINGQ